MRTITTRLRRVAARVLPPSRTQLRQVRDELAQVKAEISELRADNLRIAQLRDLVVARLGQIEADENDKDQK